MPCSSSALISVASVKRGGGSVKCWVGVTSSTVVSVALGERRQPAGLLVVVGGVVVAALGVDAGEAVEQHLGRRGAQLVGAVGQLDRRRLELLGRHLRRQRALPDQPVEPQLVGLERAPRASPGRAGSWSGGSTRAPPGRPSTSSCRRGPWASCRFAVALADDLARLAHRDAGDRGRVRSHVGDEPDLALGGLDALVQPLGDRHRPLRAEAELAARLLLERRGRERRRRRALLGPRPDLGDGRVRARAIAARGARRRLVARRRGPRRRCGRPRPRSVSPASVARSAWIVQYSRAVNAVISRSRSTTRRTATDWTRPADRPPRTLRDSSGLSV